MYHFNKLSTHLLLFLAIHYTTLDAQNQPGPYRPYSDELESSNIELKGLDEHAYSQMSLDDIRLKTAYVEVFLSTFGDFFPLKPELNAALTDMRKRGDSITPLLLKLMDENQETGFEFSLLLDIPRVETIKLEPYLDYARNVLRERTHTMSAGLAGSAAQLLAHHGTKEDAELLKWVMETRFYVKDSITRKLDELNRRLGLPKQSTGVSLSNNQIETQSLEAKEQTNAQQPSPNVEKVSRSLSWVAWILLSIVILSLLWLVSANRKKT
jgi:hypothetical protein